MHQHSRILFFVISAVTIFNYNVQGDSFERVVTDLIDVYHGVPLSFGYNESKPNNGLSSAPGCPKSEEGYPWLYYASNDSIKCYLAGSKGPCLGSWSNDGIFVVNKKDSHYGVCGCECFDPIQENFDNRSEEEKREKPHRFCRTDWGGVMALMPEYKECFQLSFPGPCKLGKHLATDDGIYSTPGSIQNAIDIWYGRLYCKDIPCYYATGGAAPKTIGAMDCELNGQKYSRLLKKCVKAAGNKIGLGK